MEDFKITFNEIDFILPSYRYNIQFSYATEKGLPFIREYILRLAQLGAIAPIHIASYFGLNEREAKEAISDLIKREELCYNAQNQIELTKKSEEYFESLGSPLNVSELRSSGAQLGFELTSLTCISNRNKGIGNGWVQGFRLNVANNKVANRDRLISKAFQRHFQDLIEDGYMDHVKDQSGGKPNIYKIESLRQIGADPIRLKLAFEMGADGTAIETDDIEVLNDSSEALELVSSVINEHARVDNHQDVLNAIELLGDVYTSKLFSLTSIKIDEFIHLKNSDVSNNGKHIPFIGCLYSQNNWSIFSGLLELEKKRIISQHQDSTVDLKWLIPSTPFWGKSDQVSSCLLDLANDAKTTGKKAKALYDLKILVPLNSSRDRSQKKNWLHELEFVKKNLHGYVEGFLDDVAEVVLLKDRLVAVTYYLNMPESYRVPVPVGFMSTDKGVIDSITHSLNGYLSEFHDENHRKNLGSIGLN